MAEVNASIENADVKSPVWNARALCTNNRVLKLTSFQIIQNETEDVQEQNLLCNMDQSLCNVDQIPTSNVTHTRGNHESGQNGNLESRDNGIANDEMENIMVHEVPQESRNEANRVEANMVDSDLKRKRSQCEGETRANLGSIDDDVFANKFLNIVSTLENANNDHETNGDVQGENGYEKTT